MLIATPLDSVIDDQKLKKINLIFSTIATYSFIASVISSFTKKPPALQREHSVLQNMKTLIFSSFVFATGPNRDPEHRIKIKKNKNFRLTFELLPLCLSLSPLEDFTLGLSSSFSDLGHFYDYLQFQGNQKNVTPPA
jgi:hypothetical protein